MKRNLHFKRDLPEEPVQVEEISQKVLGHCIGKIIQIRSGMVLVDFYASEKQVTPDTKMFPWQYFPRNIRIGQKCLYQSLGQKQGDRYMLLESVQVLQ